MRVRKATIDDIDMLVNIRLDYIRADWGSVPEETEKTIRGQLKPYIMGHLPAGEFVGMLATEGETVLGAAYLVINEKPANPAYTNGITGLILNVLTYPAYRRRGIATRLIEALIEEGLKAGASCLELSATEDGKPLYEKMGFTLARCPSMRMKLDGTDQ